jgi:toxin HigB-1
MYTQPGFAKGFGPDIVKAFRKVMGVIKDARDEQDFYALKSLHYEKLRGEKEHQRSMKLNDQFRLIVEIEETDGRNVVVVEISKHYE